MSAKIPSPLILASRGSPLALWQANYVAEKLREGGQVVEVRTWKTTGDVIQDRFLHEIGGKGLFIKELEDAMSRDQAQFAVHSLKDLPAKIPEGFKLAAVLKRHSHADVIIFRSEIAQSLNLKKNSVIDAKTLKSLGPMKIATSSLRRRSLLVRSCPEIVTIPVRGNVDTRLRKLESEDWHGIILAEASLERLNIQNVHAHRLDPEWFIPCAGQGALAIETLASSPIINILAKLEYAETRLAIDIERAVLARLGGDCTMPFGCLVTADPNDQTLLRGRAIVLSNDGNAAQAEHTISKADPNLEHTMINELISQLRKNGANEILKSLNIAVQI